MWAQLPYWYADGSCPDWARSTTTGADWNEWDTTETAAFVSLEQDLGGRWQLRGDVSYFEQVEDSKLIWLSGNPDRETGLGMDIRSEEHTSELQSLMRNSYAVFCLK